MAHSTRGVLNEFSLRPTLGFHVVCMGKDKYKLKHECVRSIIEVVLFKFISLNKGSPKKSAQRAVQNHVDCLEQKRVFAIEY